MNRIKKIFQDRTDKVIPFITAGYPSKKDTQEMVSAAEESGAAMVELGMPFSDPLADGPIIQEASKIAIGNDVNISTQNDIIAFLHEKQSSKNKDTWSKLDKTTKIIKINNFIDEIFCAEHDLNDKQCDKCKEYLLDMIDKKRLNKNKEVVYKDEVVSSVANFSFNKVLRTFFILFEF